MVVEKQDTGSKNDRFDHVEQRLRNTIRKKQKRTRTLAWLRRGLVAGFVLGSIIFYFQAVQPTILRRIADSTTQVVEKKSKDYQTAFTQSSNIITAWQEYAINYFSEDCSTEVSLDWNTLSYGLNRIPSLLSISSADFSQSTFGFIQNNELHSVKNEILEAYGASGQKLVEVMENYNEGQTIVPAMIAIRDICKQITDVGINKEQVRKTVCDDMKKVQSSFSDASAVWSSDIIENTNSFVKQCPQLAAKSYVDVINRFIEYFTELEQKLPDFEKDKQTIVELQSQFKNDTTIGLEKLQKIVNSKSTITGVWYLPDISL